MYEILFGIFTVYAFFNVLLLVFWYKIPVYQPVPEKIAEQSPVRLSLIIPVRNEAANILCLLKDLNAQTLAPHWYEVLVVDDFSEDATVQIAEQFRAEARFSLKVLRLEDRNAASPKKQAIGMGIQEAEGTLIVTTDGDCRVQKGWLETLRNFYLEKNAALISGAVTFYDEKKLFERIQTIEFASLIGSGAACLKFGFPTMCNGANLCYTKEAFMQVGGYQGVDQIASGDDEFLLHKIANTYPDRIFFLKNAQNIVFTQAKPNWNDFYQQRKRWSGKWKYYQDYRIKLVAFFIFVVNSALLASVLGLGAGILSLRAFWGLIALKFLPEALFLGIILAYLMKRTFWPLIPLVQLVYPFYVVFFGFAAQGKTYTWKGRTLK